MKDISLCTFDYHLALSLFESVVMKKAFYNKMHFFYINKKMLFCFSSNVDLNLQFTRFNYCWKKDCGTNAAF